MGKFTFKDRQDRGEDFLRFLNTEHISIDGMSKGQVAEFYNDQYKKYLRQIIPGQSIPSFSSVLQPLFMNGIIHLKGAFFYLGSHDNARSEAADTVNGVGPGGDASSAASWGRPYYRKFAVDQHKILKKLERAGNRSPTAEDSGQTESDEPLPEYISVKDRVFFCKLCSAPCTSQQEVVKHVDGRRHRVAVLVHKLKSEKDKLTKNKHGVVISVPSDGQDADTVLLYLKEQHPRDITLTIKNVSSAQSVELVSCELLKRIRVFQLDDVEKVTESQNSVVIQSGQTYDIQIRAEARNIGSYHSPLALQFRHVDNADSTFHIVKYLHAKCQNETMEEIKKGVKNVRRENQFKKTRSQRKATRTINGYPLPKFGSDKLERKVELKQYLIPDSLRKMINHGLANTSHLKQFEKIELTALRKMLEDQVTMETYCKKMSTLMHFEEIQMEVDIQQYDIEDIMMLQYHRNKRLLLLDVPGLAESRPSVLRGDQLFVRIRDNGGNTSEREYQGFVHEILQTQIALGFHESLMKEHVHNTRFNVRFIFNRLPIRLMHRACELADELSLEKLIFPTVKSIGSFGQIRPVHESLKYFSTDPHPNKEQDIAIRHIVSGTSRPAPYLVFGPPGTGKTFTIVEAMKQIWKCIPDSHILACAPSNTAADLIVERLLKHLPIKDIFRLNAASRVWATIPEKIRDVCNYDTHESRYFYPNKESMMKYRIVVSTLITGGRLASADFPSDHFTHVFIDEAGYAVEPECVIAVAGILDCNPNVKNGGQLVLAGDPEQLRAILRSPFAVKYNLDRSLLERLMEDHTIYGKIATSPDSPAQYNDTVLTKLVKNYRSHKVILHLSNKHFYDGELEEAAPEIRQLMCQWEGLPRTHFPLIFHAVIGEDMREEKSPSFFNLEEICVVVKYVKDLMESRVQGKKLKQEEIGVISPYRKQVQKIKTQLAKNRLFEKIKVGSVEEFQGSEKLIIIVSTVRSNPKYLSLDARFNLGFLNNPKRFNVTMTRAKALLIVIGNPLTLQMDSYWGSLIQYCKDNGSVFGEDLITDPEQDFDDVLQRMAAVNLESPDSKMIKTATAEEHPWRKDM
ncbi:putative helicase MOV-10 [Gigantopelta aegis]|uniref:putative helicase MOV-10 n=1 Tax=Gigantopelta aegis TaxID=1735272 RepID=UPI001B88D720|nr:putative helicase MOV-10 [Gigantopelta aegis]